jgi:hypothetical protein
MREAFNSLSRNTELLCTDYGRHFAGDRSTLGTGRFVTNRQKQI